MPSVLLVRHGQGSFGGADYDVLSELGREQARAVTDDLRRRGARVDRVLSGSLARQRDTAAPIAEAFGREVEVDERWNEYVSEDILAHYSGSDARLERQGDADAPAMSTRDFQRILDGALHGWIEAGADGPSGEPYGAFTDRVHGALEDVTSSLGSGEVAVVSTSGGVLAAVCVALLGVPPAAFVAFNRVVVNTGITRLAHGRGGTTLVSFNEHAHLESPGRSLITYR